MSRIILMFNHLFLYKSKSLNQSRNYHDVIAISQPAIQKRNSSVQCTIFTQYISSKQLIFIKLTIPDLIQTQLQLFQQFLSIMTSFQLVNHQIKHMFGGIEAEKNSSLEYLQTIQKKITKTMEKAQTNHMKIYQAVATVKSSLTELSENYLSMSKQNKHSSGLISKLTCEITDLLQGVSQQSLSLAKKMESKVQTYVPNLVKIKQKYTECAQTLEHYRKKVSLLKKNVEKQSLANIKQDQHQRFERNKEKLRNAQKQYDQILIKTTKRYVEFNNEGMKDIQNDLISVLANIGANVMECCNNLTKHLCQHFSAHQLLLSKQLKIPNRKLSQKIVGDQLKPAQQAKTFNLEKRKALFEHLTEQRQIQNYLKKIIEKEMAKQDSQLINDIFKTKKLSVISQKQNVPNGPFNQFQNIYNNHELKHHNNHLLEKLKEPDPIQGCQDLLEIEEATEISKGYQIEQMSKSDIIELSPPPQEKLKDSHFEQRMKKNLDKFNKICQQNHLERNKSPGHSVKPLDKAISPNFKAIEAYKLQNNGYNSSKTVLKSPDQFFNLNYLEIQKKNENLKAPQQELVKMHQHPFNFAIFQQEQKANFIKQPNNTPNNSNFPQRTHFQSAITQANPTIKPVIQSGAVVSFDNFDIFLKEHQKPQNSKEKKIAIDLNNADLLSL